MVFQQITFEFDDMIVELHVRSRVPSVDFQGEAGDLRSIWPEALAARVEAALARPEEPWECTRRW